MRFIIACIGSFGDCLPLIALGVSLKDRGHAVTMLANSYFEKNIRRVGLDFHAIGNLDDYHAMLRNPESIPTVCNTQLSSMRPVFAYISEQYVPGETAVICNIPASIGPRLAHEKLGIPMITVNLVPMSFGSCHEPPLFTFRRYPSWLPPWFFRSCFSVLSTIYDHYLYRPLNEFRRELAMSAQPRSVIGWMPSPQKIISLFPAWFGKPQPDWPSQNELTGFPFFDNINLLPSNLPEGLQAFLDDGPPPIIFTPGTPNKRFSAFFEKAAQATINIGARAVFIATHEEQIPDNLPEQIQFYQYAPFSTVFPRAALVVHHGGIGTTSLALRAGVPQLLTPWGFDQFDHSARVKDLGVGSVINAKKCTVEELSQEIRLLMDSSEVHGRCRMLAKRMEVSNSLKDTCEALEAMLGIAPPASMDKAGGM